jgi:hypothetical protein
MSIVHFHGGEHELVSYGSGFNIYACRPTCAAKWSAAHVG